MIVEIEVQAEHIKAAQRLGLTQPEVVAIIESNALRKLNKMVEEAKRPLANKKTIDELEA